MESLKKAISDVAQELFGQEVSLELTRPEEQFGDYATNVALQLAGKLGKNPREIADQLAQALSEQFAGAIKEVTVAGPGFINLHLSDESLWELNQEPITKPYTDQKIVIETNNPNPFKDIHIGHAFNSIVADTIANLLEAGGAEVHRVSYHGDVGLHVGKSLWAIINLYGENATQELDKISESDRPTRLREWYAHGAGMYEEEPNVKSEVEMLARQSFTPSGFIAVIYDTCKSWSFEYFEQVFTRLGSKSVERRYLESQTDKVGREIVEANTPKVFTSSDGAIVFHGEEHDKSLHTRVFISKHGTTLYEARDLGLMQLKTADYQPDKSYIVTAVEQKDYFKVVFKAAELAMPDMKTQTINIPTGTVKLTTGKMSSRTGQVVTIEWLFSAVEEAVREVTQNPETVQSSSLAAIRYAMLKSRLDGDILFNIESSVALEGNTGPYLQYAHARARSILKKADGKEQKIDAVLESGERSLLRKITEYNEVIDRAMVELMPHHITTYLYELSQTFNRFYEHNHVLGDERESIRLQLVTAYADVLKKGLELLNIPAPDKM